MNNRYILNLFCGFFLIGGLTMGSSCTKTVCDNTCAYAYDGQCDDGGQNSLYSICDCGTDCADCGERKKGTGPASSCK